MICYVCIITKTSPIGILQDKSFQYQECITINSTTMSTINPYLNFNGTTEEAFLFYKEALGGEILTIQRFKDTPEAGSLTPELGEKLMHISLKIGDTVLMGTDALESQGFKIKEGNNFHLSLNAKSEVEAETFFSNLSKGGKVTQPLAKQFWGAYFGMLTDKFGTNWMVSYDTVNPN